MHSDDDNPGFDRFTAGFLGIGALLAFSGLVVFALSQIF